MALPRISRLLRRSTSTASRPATRTRRLLSASTRILALCALASLASAGEPVFTPPQFLPGDMAIGLTAGHQEEMEVAAGGGGFLAVWSDLRSSMFEFQGLEGSGYDIYGALMDGSGNVLDTFVIDEGPGNQALPHVAWNGQNWLVAWMEPDPSGYPVYERIRAVRVAPDGTVLDPSPILIHEESSGCYCSFFGLAMAGGGTDGWVVTFTPNGAGLYAVRVQADGVVANPGGLLVKGGSAWQWDIVFAQDEYLIIWKGDTTRARRYSPTLQGLGTTTLPFASEVATDGTNFLITGQSDTSWPPTLEALLLGHNGSVLVPRFTIAVGNAVTGPTGEGAGFDGSDYWVTWDGTKAARVTPSGQLLDPGGFTIPLGVNIYRPAYDGAPGGGFQFLWSDGGGGQGNPKDVLTARLTSTGQVVSQGPVSVSTPAQVEPDFAEGDGIHMIVFRSRSSKAARILAQRLDDDGVALDPEPIEVASGPVQWLQAPSIDAPQVAWNGSVFMVTWSDTVDVLARRMNPDGTFVDATPLVIMPGRSTTVGALGTTFLVGGSLVGYSSGTLQPPGALRVARVDGVTGAVLDNPPIQVGGASDRHPHIVTLGGRWLVVWESVTHDPWSSSVFYATGAVFVEADGTTTGQLATDLSKRPNVAVSGDRALLVAVDGTVSGGYTDLEARILMADGTFLGPRFDLSTAFDEQLNPAATWTGSEFLVGWEDKRNSVIHFDDRTDIFGARVTADGLVLDPAGVALLAGPEVETQPEFLTVGGTTLLAVSTLRSDDPTTEVFRLGIQSMYPGPTTYCTASTTSIPGCQASIESAGAPSLASPGGFTVSSGNVPGGNLGICFFGSQGQAATPFGTLGGQICVQPPIYRSHPRSSGGTQGVCDGQFTFTLQDMIDTSPIVVAGVVLDVEIWARDPANPDGFMLSDGLEFKVFP